MSNISNGSLNSVDDICRTISQLGDDIDKFFTNGLKDKNRDQYIAFINGMTNRLSQIDAAIQNYSDDELDKQWRDYEVQFIARLTSLKSNFSKETEALIKRWEKEAKIND